MPKAWPCRRRMAEPRIEADAALAAAVEAGDRRALARAITLVESTRADHRAAAAALIDRLLPGTGRSIRLGVSGPPGVGKSTFIESFGLHLISLGRRVAVLAVDPSSRVSGGSILGDKTRMSELAKSDGAFIRPSPAGATLGGVSRRTREAVLLVEAAGFDVVMVETVGVGQSETAVADLTDMFLLLAQPGAGDELQGLKRGIVELADLVVVGKADGELAKPAMRAAAEYRQALRLMQPPTPGWTPEVRLCSGLTGQGVPEVWKAVERFAAGQRKSGAFKRRRAAQGLAWLGRELEHTLVDRLKSDRRVARLLRKIETDVAAGRVSPGAGAQSLIDAFLRRE